MYWFGDIHPSLDVALDPESWKALGAKRLALYQTQIEDIIELLDAFSYEWKEDSQSFNEALPRLVQESGFSEEDTRKTLALLPGLLKQESLLRRVQGEFSKIEVLNRFVKLPSQSALVRAIPQGTLLHVTAGNVFLSSIDSLIMGFLTKNLSIVKVSSQNTYFPNFFAERLRAFDRKNILADKFSILHWKGGDEKTESLMKTKVDTIIAWGGEEMLSSYRKNLPPHVKLLDFGPKISFQLVTKAGLQHKGLSAVAQKIVADIIPWDQGACASPQNLYLEEGINEEDILRAIDLAFLEAPKRGEISEDEATEILKEQYRGFYSELMENGKVIKGNEHLIHREENRLLKPSPLHRSLIVKRFKDKEELFTLLEPFSYYLQSCSYLLSEKEHESYLNTLALTGIKRFAPLGTVTYGMDGAPHDGRFVLRELVKFIGDERRVVDYGEEASALADSGTLKTHFQTREHPPGYIFSSGGTTGEPKFVTFSFEEFDYLSDMLAKNLRGQGIKTGMKVANLFVAGNLWSSFMCIDRALEKIGAVVLPIGGLCTNENIALYLHKFKPDVVMGIPSMLVMNAEYMETQGLSVEIPKIFYAGEALSQIRREYLSRVWKTTYYGSAGYASVDAGAIGYQCVHSGPGEHHLLSDLVELNIIDEEAVVTSLMRDSMGVKNYRTGDRVEWLEGTCACGSSDPRFKLMGRIDNVIQIWSCRLLTSDIESVMTDNKILSFQLTVSESREANLVREKLEITFESEMELDQEQLLLEIYHRSRDVRDTIKFNEFRKDLILNRVDQVPRNTRTGKISLVKDLRR